MHQQCRTFTGNSPARDGLSPRGSGNQEGKRNPLVTIEDNKGLLEPLDARHDKDMKRKWDLAILGALSVELVSAISEARVLLIGNSRKQHRVSAACENSVNILPRLAFPANLFHKGKGDAF